MKYLPVLMLSLAWSLPPAFAGEAPKSTSSVESFNDYVKIRYMPSRSGFIKEKEPVTELIGEASTIVAKHDGSVMGTNDQIKALYERAAALRAQGIGTNQQHFHIAVTRLEMSYRGETVTLEYVGPSGEEKFAAYEQAWQKLYRDAYQFLTTRLQPDEGDVQP